MNPAPLPALSHAWPLPSRPRPIVIIGAGGIVNDAHLPAYRKAGFPVAGIFDIDAARAQAAARKFSIPQVFAALEEAAAQPGVVFDLAVPPERTFGVLEQLPSGAAVLMQKPMGTDLEEARRIRRLCRDRKLTAAVNFQLRFSPMMLAMRDAVAKGLLGPILDLEVRLNLRTAWELFPFLKKLDRVEIQVHSIHYLDWIRSLLGEPRGVYARTLPHPSFPSLKSTRSSIILDYGEAVRCCLSLNHHFEFGPKHEAAAVTVQGSKGAGIITLGLLLNYPDGKPETVELITDGSEWTQVPIEGRWFPHGFIGRMANVQRFAAGEDAELIASVEDAFKTMALVEACYQSSASGGTPIPE
ncbi:MAG: Gfo/Idh/MocA family oxidoreductase [Planctomycetes bacterium]|nr:Gfo/Idh/MocA family oxidoreductase [Planctomycetota bacterium]